MLNKFVTVLILSVLLVGFDVNHNLEKSVSNSIEYLKQKQNSDGSWSGAFVTDASIDALALAIGEKLGLIDEKLKQEIYNSVIQRIDASKLGWPAYYGGPIDRDVTGTILLIFQSVGFSRTDPNLEKSWAWFDAQGRESSLRPLARALLLPLGLVKRNLVPRLTPKILGLPEMAPLQINKIGGFIKEFVIPFTAWQVLSGLKEGELAKDFQNLDGWMKEKVTIGSYKIPDNEKTNKKLTGKPHIDLTNSFVNAMVGGSDVYWAKQGLAHSLQVRNPTGTWYSVGITMINLLALQEAQRVGLGNFTEQLVEGWQGVLKWRSVSKEGISIQQIISSDIWDTSLALTALQNLKGTQWYDESLRLISEQGAEWLESKRIPGAGWSFDSTDRTLSDIDDTGTVLHALSYTTDNDLLIYGLDWILENQNDDGGFPAWGKGVSKTTFSIVNLFFKDMPEAADFSQADVTARILFTLTTLEKKGIVSAKTLKPIREKACDFLLGDSEKVSGIDVPAYVGHWFTNYIYAASQVTMGLVHGKCKQDTLQDILKWIASVQNPDGGWGEDNLSYRNKEFILAPSSLSQTTMILFGLINTYEKVRLPFLKSSIERAIEFLTNKTELGTNFFDPSFTGILVKNSAYARYELLPAYMSLYAFGSWAKLQ